MTGRFPRFACALAGPGFAVLFVATAVVGPRPRLLWNASASTPIGLYAIETDAPIARGDFAAIRPPATLAKFLARRGYLPTGLPLLKQVAAVAGQQLCRSGATITIDGIAVGIALARDRAGRALPVWQGCQRIPDGQLFLMNPAVRDSFDGRYFGLVSTRQVIGRALPLWTDTLGRGRFEWRSRAR